jgi:hypothetical protein
MDPIPNNPLKQTARIRHRGPPNAMLKIMRFIVIAVLVAIAVGAALQFSNSTNGESPAAGQPSGWMQR